MRYTSVRVAGSICLALLPTAASSEAIPQVADFPNIAKLEQFEPANNEMRCGGEFLTVALMSAAAEEPVDYLGFLTVNGLPTAPFTLTLLPGDVTVRERMHWPIRVIGKAVNVRFRLVAIGKNSKRGYQVAEVSKDYNLGKKQRGKYQGC
jgi:hypothetical protein